MKILSKICRSLTEFHEDPESIFDSLAAGPQLKKLAGAALNGVESDERAAQLLGFDSSQDERYHSVKYRFWHLIPDFAFMASLTHKLPPFRRAEMECQKLEMLITFLASNGEREAMTIVAQRLRKKAIRYGFTQSLIKALQILRMHTATKGNTSNYNNLNDALIWSLECQQAEIESAGLYAELTPYFAKSAAHTPRVLPKVQRAVKAVQEYRKRYDTPQLWEYHFRLLIFEAEVSGDMDAAKEACQQGARWYKKRQHLARPARIGEFHLHAAAACYYLRQTVDGLKEIAGAIANYTNHSPNWRVAQEYNFLLLMQHQEYKSAADVCSLIITNLDNDQHTLLEKWDLFAGSLVVAYPEALDRLPVRVKGITPDNFGKRFKLFSRDKRGYNISIEILNYVLLLRDFAAGGSAARHDELLAAATAIRRRHTDTLRKVKRFHYRSSVTVRTLADLAREDFVFKKCAQKVKAALKRIANVPAEYGGKLDTVEALPFNDVLRIALEAVREIDAQGYVSGRDYDKYPARTLDYEKFVQDAA